ncbi:MAG TPA: nucleotidyltransferase domain-containing protein [Burkholderiales bacterium]|nr:nucleotidyltransferase domain-containing protein [Burkholderiales bacterium]
MGRSNNSSVTGLAQALFSGTQQRILGLLFGQPDRSFFATELIALSGGGSGGVQRELARLVASGLVNVTRIGNQKHYQANRESPIFEELHGIMRKTVGLAEPLRDALAPFANQVRAAFIYGSVAQGADTARSDIDLMIVSEGLSYVDVIEALQTVETKLGRPVNPTLYTPTEWQKKRAQGSAFVSKVGDRPKIFLIGSEDDLT